ncbi:MAG: thymidine phosphorylase [Frankiales bacterium]|nr:thymidine phosphorylase [Frankiales bacterium]
MDVVDLIRAKRGGARLTDEQISWLLKAYVAGDVADEQVSALLMAIVFQGMTRDELAFWTQCMIDSGERLDLSSVSKPTVDKHSTGGVGDKISLVLAPLIAACGAAMPQLSGRGLGHTGGTLDKMEAIPGFRSDLDPAAMIGILDSVGAVIAAAGPGLVPVDRKLYALRDVTGTVESRYLIASSIMSKKIAEGTASLVLDVKVGTGAFLPDPVEARELATLMVELGEAHGVRTTALLTAMDTPLGSAAGNAVEVSESIEVLQGGGPADVRDLTLALAREMVALAGIDVDPATRLDDGSAYDAWRAMLVAQGGDPDAKLPQARHSDTVVAEADGYLSTLEARSVGIAAWRLGAGRARKEDPVSPTAGVLCLAKPGDLVRAGQPVLTLLTDEPERFERAREALAGAILVSAQPPAMAPLVIFRIGS